ncbi:hypothetical protein [Microvirga sp. TS319]|uniref:hypothetical protein n=1 Tax=Microvirga sp. TS319 TaxID=3241165 RepID=UPI00351A64F7
MIIEPTEWDAVQEQFEGLFMKLGCPGQMMLVASAGSGPPTLFASLPNPGLLNALTGCERIDDSKLPPEASLLIGHPHVFEKRFIYPKWKPAS